MQISDIVGEVASTLGVDQPAAENVVGTVLSVLRHEAEGAKIEALFARVPGAGDLAQQYDVMAAGASGGGLMGMIGSALGERAGALINGVTRLERSGLTMAQVQQAGDRLYQQLKTAGGPSLVEDVFNQVPGLKGHLGL